MKERFWSKVDKRGADECWEWTACVKSNGYGHFSVARSIARAAHRVAWELTHGPIPEGPGYHGVCVCHRCDNRRCCNPAHLFLGTQRDNMRDKDLKGRGNLKLTDADVAEIRALKGSLSASELGRRFGVPRKYIWRIHSGERRGVTVESEGKPSLRNPLEQS